jgi:ribosomal 50S subunit-associated protein YjgA (DUF615 family)
MNTSDTENIQTYLKKKWTGVNFPKDTIFEMIDFVCKDVYEKYPMVDPKEIRILVDNALKEKSKYYYFVFYKPSHDQLIKNK